MKFISAWSRGKMTGAVSQLSWDMLAPDLNKAFRIKPNEKIVEVSASSDGLKVRIERKDS